MGENREVPVQTQEMRDGKWGYESHFREYLLLLARKGKHALESIDNFPQEIELSRGWHETLNKMADETIDGHERLALIGFGEDMRKLVMPATKFGIGENRNEKNNYRANIPISVYNSEIQRAKKIAGVVGFLGHIHTHPQGLLGYMAREFLGSSRFLDGGGGFSAGDLYFLVSKKAEFTPIICVVDGEEVFFAFKTRQTKYVPTTMSQDDFEQYWYGKMDVFRKGGSSFYLNKVIAKEYNLAFYRGRYNKDIGRVYPVFFNYT